MNESLQYELQHLLNLSAPPYRESWDAYIRAKARGLAKHYPQDYSELPRMLEEALGSPPCDKDTPTTGEASR